ncbi:MAG: 50S ribosomal protein L23 [Pseudomonadota bacterium]|nr:50S ribosomal protein L23 [Pseudomonadota bacterium]
MMSERIYKVLLGPLTSEKTTRLADRQNQVVFKVMTDATKIEIKKAIEHLFKVSVEKVRVLNVKPQTVRNRNGLGQRKGWKKAYVKLSEGQEINFSGLV